MASCPLCGGELLPGGAGQDAPRQLGSWPLRHCPRCHHTSTPAAYGVAADYEALYDADYAVQQIAPLRDARHHAELALLPPYAAFFHALGPAQGRTLLDVGCGAGRFLIAARLHGWTVRGIEPAQRAVEAAQATGLWLPISHQTPEELAATGALFDVVTLFDVLEHVADPVALLRSVLPLLKPGGSLFLTVPNWDCPLMQQARRPDWLPPVHLQFFSAASLESAVAAATPPDVAPLHITGCGAILSDPAPPLRHPGPWLRWASRRLRRRPVYAAQLWLHAQALT